MRNRQIVVISGKAYTGKRGLADLLAREFEFRVIHSDELLEKLDGVAFEQGNRTSLLERRLQLNAATESKWLLDAVEKVMQEAPKDKRPIVVDHVDSLAQVVLFRKRFFERLTHVHLYAKDETLSERYAEYQVKEGVGPLPYTEVDHLSAKDVEELKKDADVRVYTTRSDPRDTLVRVAARLHLYAPPDLRCVDVVIGGQFGSEGKGNIASYLAKEYDVLVRVGGPNAGHTIARPGGTYTHHHLPSGAQDTDGLLLLGPGMTIHVDKLLAEIKECNIQPGRLFIDPQATIIEEVDTREEKKELVSTIGSTGSGSGAAAARRIMSRGDPNFRMAKDIPELAPYVGTEGNYHGTTVDQLEKAYRASHSILLEGTQGSGLSIYHGHYPYVTSRDTNVAGCLAEAGISPSRVRKIIMVIRPMPIRVGDPEGSGGHTSGPMKYETTFEKIAEDSDGLQATALRNAEKTSTTKRNRRVGWFEWELFRKACALNAPTDIVLTFADYLSASNQDARRFEQLNINTVKFVEELERVSQAPVSLINIRFPREDVGSGMDDLRTLIDRRNWTGRHHTGNK